MRISLIAAALIALAMPVRAEPGPIGTWLMEQPVTLWDWGMMKVRRDAQRASDHISGVAMRWLTGVRYDWDNNEISIHLRADDYRGDVSHANCIAARRSFIRTLSALDLSHDASDEDIRTWTHWTISHWFSHDGFDRESRDDEELAEKMARIIFVAVTLRDAGNAVGCRARITAFDAPSRPVE